MEKIGLTKSECEAVMSYIWNASRGSPNGKAYKTWQKMFDFVNDEQQELNFKEVKKDREVVENIEGKPCNEQVEML